MVAIVAVFFQISPEVTAAIQRMKSSSPSPDAPIQCLSLSSGPDAVQDPCLLLGRDASAQLQDSQEEPRQPEGTAKSYARHIQSSQCPRV